MSVTVQQSADHLVERFRERAEPLGVQVQFLTGVDALATAVVAFAAENDLPAVLLSDELVTGSPKLPEAIAQLGLTVTVVDSVEDARDHPFGLALAAAGISESGSAVMAEHTLEDRAVAMTTLAVMIVITKESMLWRLEDAIPLLRTVANRRGGGNATFITGPSRTADIEMSLTVGVQGPAKVSVVIVENLGEGISA